MNKKVYNKVCSKIGHNWAFKDCDTFMLKVCLDCRCEQAFFPEEVDELNADVDDHNSKEN